MKNLICIIAHSLIKGFEETSATRGSAQDSPNTYCFFDSVKDTCNQSYPSMTKAILNMLTITFISLSVISDKLRFLTFLSEISY